MDFFEAVARADIGTVRAAIKEAPSRIDSTDRGGRTALMYAALEGKADIVRLLLEGGADPNAQDQDNWTPLHFAAQSYDALVASILLEFGATLDVRNKYGNTPLFIAVVNSRGSGELITLLIEKGSDKNLKNNYGVSPLSLAESIGNYDVAKFLK
jgi:ankyrin repeat protein